MENQGQANLHKGEANSRSLRYAPRISCFAELATTTDAALRKESRTNFINATKLNRKYGERSGGTCCFSPLFWFRLNSTRDSSVFTLCDPHRWPVNGWADWCYDDGNRPFPWG
jgi:hypothetical protein